MMNRVRAILDVIYVNYNSTGLLQGSIASLRHHAGAEGIAVHIHVVDNNSRPADATALDRLAGDIALTRSDRNLGFGAACNLAVKGGHAPFLLFLNPDTLVLPGTLPDILAVLHSHDGEVLVGPRLYADRKQCISISPMRGTTLWGDVVDVLHDRGWLPRRTFVFLRNRMAIYARQEPVAVPALPGCALAVGRRAFTRLGGFDTRYFLYHEDNDLCLRARSLGLPILYLPASGIVHWLERSTDTDRPLAMESIRRGREVLLPTHHGVAARWLKAAVFAVVTRLPRLGRRGTRAVDINPEQPLSLPPASAGSRRVVEIARSTLFDNCLTVFPGGEEFLLPVDFYHRLFPGEYYVRVAMETRPGKWKEQGLHRLVKETPAAGIHR